jgi:hypothetical protein
MILDFLGLKKLSIVQTFINYFILQFSQVFALTISVGVPLPIQVPVYARPNAFQLACWTKHFHNFSSSTISQTCRYREQRAFHDTTQRRSSS